MDKNELLSRVAAVVSTLDDTDGSPESMLYIFCNMNMAEYEILRDVLVKSGMVTIKNHYATLTADGKATAIKLEAVMRKH